MKVHRPLSHWLAVPAFSGRPMPFRLPFRRDIMTSPHGYKLPQTTERNRYQMKQFNTCFR